MGEGKPHGRGAILASWVFDVVSPYAYLAFPDLKRLPAGVRIEYVPVLLAGLLNHFGQVGPAEIPSKRRFTYRFVVWRARRLGLPLRMPPAHPFNSLAAQRLIIAAGNTESAVATVLDAVFRDGRDVGNPAVVAELAHQVGVSDPQRVLAEPGVKQRLRENTEWASAHGVFGVPTLVIGEEFFWGHDATDMALEYLADPKAFHDRQMQAIETLPIGAERRRDK
jgi:2-hydroxychromene-2-carboxylate isomerase